MSRELGRFFRSKFQAEKRENTLPWYSNGGRP
jgi:hypothetical protein